MNKLKLIDSTPKFIRLIARKAYTAMAKNPLLRRHFPLSTVNIETTNLCNLRCPGCYRTSHDYPSKNKNMSFEDFKLYIDQLPPARFLVMHGLGEPTINPDLPKMVKYAYNTKKFICIDFVTNLLARKPTIYDGLFADGLTRIRVSVDTLNQQEVDLLRTGTNIELMKENLKYLLARYADKISILMVCSKVNIHTFEKTVEELIKLGVKKVGFQPYENGGESSRCPSEAEKAEFLRIINNFKKKNIDVVCSVNFEPPKGPCVQLYTAPTITVDGYLTPCCRILNKEIFNFGSLKDTRFKDLYYTKRIDEMQKGMIEGRYPSFCNGCVNKHV